MRVRRMIKGAALFLAIYVVVTIAVALFLSWVMT